MPSELMDRIKVKSFLTFSYTEKLELIKKVRAIRTTARSESQAKKVKPKKKTKSALKNKRIKEKGILTKKKEKQLQDVLNELTPEQLEIIKEKYK